MGRTIQRNAAANHVRIAAHSFLPKIPGDERNVGALLFLGLVFCALTLAWLTGYALAVAKAGDFLRRPSIGRILEGLTGTALVALGLRLAAERR